MTKFFAYIMRICMFKKCQSLKDSRKRRVGEKSLTRQTKLHFNKKERQPSLLRKHERLHRILKTVANAFCKHYATYWINENTVEWSETDLSKWVYSTATEIQSSAGGQKGDRRGRTPELTVKTTFQDEKVNNNCR